MFLFVCDTTLPKAAYAEPGRPTPVAHHSNMIYNFKLSVEYVGQPMNCDLCVCSADAAQRDGHWWNQEVHQQATLGRSRRYVDHYVPRRVGLDGVANTSLGGRRLVEMPRSELPQVQHG